jgi:hypothetical protein
MLTPNSKCGYDFILVGEILLSKPAGKYTGCLAPTDSIDPEQMNRRGQTFPRYKKFSFN